MDDPTVRDDQHLARVVTVRQPPGMEQAGVRSLCQVLVRFVPLGTAAAVEVPRPVPFDLGAGQPLPGSRLPLAQPRLNDDGVDPRAVGDDLRRLPGAPQIRAHEHLEGPKQGSGLRGVTRPPLGEGNIRLPLPASKRVPLALGVPQEQESNHDRRRYRRAAHSGGATGSGDSYAHGVPTLRLFASVRQVAGVSVATVEGATVGEVLAAASQRFGAAFEEQLRSCRIWCNGEPAFPQDPVGADDEIAALPPVSGGAGATGRLAILSMHTSPLVQPGSGDSGGMNVYVRELSAALAHRAMRCSVYVRRFRADLPPEIHVEPGVRVVHVPAGPPDLPKEALGEVLDAFTGGVLADIGRTGGVDAIHAHYWLSGVAGHRIKHALDKPLVTTFHTLARTREAPGEADLAERARAEEKVVACSDVVCANGPAEAEELVRLYGASPDRIEIVAPGVDHALFSPGDPEGARAALGLGREPILLFVGRVQPLKGLDLAVQTLASLDGRAGAAKLLVVGGPSGPGGRTELARVRDLLASAGLDDRVRFVAPQPHHRLATYYRAADVVVVPSRSESFGLVALEAAACGAPVVAAEVGGLKALVRHGRTGYLVAGRDRSSWASRVEEILEDPLTAAAMALEAAAAARGYSWEATAGLLARCYDRLRRRRLVECFA